jgi:hypothetical protein
MRIFIVFTIVRSVTSPSGAIFNVIGKPSTGLKMYLILTPLIFLGVGVGSLFGVAGVTIGVSLARIISGTVSFAVSLVAVEAGVLRGFRALVPSSLAAAVMTVAVYGARFELQALGVPLGARLAACIVVGVVLYPLLLRAVSKAAFDDALQLARKLSPRFRKRAP